MQSDLFKKSALLGLLLLPALSMAADKPIPPAKPETPVVATADKEPIYGYQLMTEEERATFRTQMQNAATDEERQQIRLQHRERMLERAKAQGVTLTDPPAITPGDEVVFGGQMMTMEERLQFRTQMQNAATDEERQQIRLQHREQMLERAKAQGITLPDMPMMNGQGMGKGMGMGQGGSSSGSGSSGGSGNSSGSSGSSAGSGNSSGSSGNSGSGGNSGGGGSGGNSK